MPICPQCKAEYRAEFTRCADCDVDLVEAQTSPEPAEPVGKLEAVFITTRFDEAFLVRSILEDRGIRAFVDNEHGAALAVGIPTPAIPFIVRVSPGEQEDAKHVLEEVGKLQTVPKESHEHPPTLTARTRTAWIIGIGLLLLCLPYHYNSNVSESFWAGASWSAIMIATLILLHTHKLFDGVPGRLLVVFFLYGALGAAGLGGAVEYVILEMTSLEIHSFVFSSVIVGPVEESAKILGPLVILSFIPSWRKNRYAWALAAAASGGGFGVVENLIAYSIPWRYGDTLSLFVMRSGVVLHLLLTFYVGVCVAKGGFAGFIGGLLVASFIHGTWNALAVTEASFLNLGFVIVGLILLRGFLRREVETLEEKKEHPLVPGEEGRYGDDPLGHPPQRTRE